MSKKSNAKKSYEKESEKIEEALSFSGGGPANTVRKEPVSIPKKEPVKKEPELPEVQFKVFQQVSGVKPDQLAGFACYIKNLGIDRATVTEWKALYEKYKVKPVK